MTVSNPSNDNIFDGDGSTVLFSFTFQLPSDSTGTDIYVYVIDSAGNITLITSNLTLDLVNKTVTYPVTGGISPLANGINALPAGWQLGVFRIEQLTQALNMTTQGPFPAAGIMAAFDKLTLITQQLQEQINRCVKYPIGELPTTTDVNAFIAAVNAIIQPPMTVGTYAYVKSVAALAPTTARMFGVTDQNSNSTTQLYFYSGNVAAGDGGWFGPITGA